MGSEVVKSLCDTIILLVLRIDFLHAPLYLLLDRISSFDPSVRPFVTNAQMLPDLGLLGELLSITYSFGLPRFGLVMSRTDARVT